MPPRATKGAEQGDDFRILGDLTERVEGEYTSPARRLIVRMFVGDSTFDEEMDFDSIGEVRTKVAKRMAALRKKPNKKALAVAEPPHPSLDHGHAIPLPEPK